MDTIAIVGATGLVGRTILQVLEEQKLPDHNIVLLASARSAGQKIVYRGKEHVVQPLTEKSFEGIQYSLWSAGGSVSKQYAPYAAASGCVVIDNSSQWRMDPNVPLVVPEVNPAEALKHKNIIANPNCSTIQLVVALEPLHKQFGLQRVIVSTYQSVSGAGINGVKHLEAEIAGNIPDQRISSHPLAYNVVFHGIPDVGQASVEEQKMIQETRRIMNIPELPIAVTCVRVPVLGAHSESIAAEFKRPVTAQEAREILSNAPGIIVMDNPAADEYPTPLQAQGKDEVFVGRIRKDPSSEHGILMWVVADNLRKGAATNAVQILQVLLNNK